MLKPFEMNEVEMLFDKKSAIEYIKEAATAEPEKTVVTEAAGEETTGEEETDMPEEGMDEGGEGEAGSDEDMEEIREAVMNFISLSKGDLESLKESDPDLFEELCDSSKEICEMMGYTCEKSEE